MLINELKNWYRRVLLMIIKKTPSVKTPHLAQNRAKCGVFTEGVILFIQPQILINPNTQHRINQFILRGVFFQKI
jgi:hypothetical protein